LQSHPYVFHVSYRRISTTLIGRIKKVMILTTFFATRPHFMLTWTRCKRMFFPNLNSTTKHDIVAFLHSHLYFHMRLMGGYLLPQLDVFRKSMILKQFFW
jgi:hypothetical protein